MDISDFRTIIKPHINNGKSLLNASSFPNSFKTIGLVYDFNTCNSDCLGMKKSKFTEAQIVFAIKQFETGTRVDEISRQMGISQATFFNWKKKYGSMGVSELRKLRQLEEENQQLKKLVADLSLDKQMLQDVIKKSYKTHV
jgi:putative transposase